MIHKYPYTNYNEYNLDWIIKRVKELTEDWIDTHGDWDEMVQSFTTLQGDFNDLHNYVYNYFANLDVSEEISSKLDEMAGDGTLLNVIENAVINYTGRTTEAWLQQHITQETGYVLDSTLTLANAAAPAKTVGDALDEIEDTLDEIESEYSYLYGALTDAGVMIPFTGSNRLISETGQMTSNADYILTSRIPVEAGMTIRVHLDYESPENAWATYAVYDDSSHFLGLTQLVNGSSTVLSYDGNIDFGEDGYFRLNYKSTATCSMNDVTPLTSDDISDGAITTDKIAGEAVTTSKIATGNVTASKIASGAVIESKIGPYAVTTGKIKDNAVTTGKIADRAVTSVKIENGAVTSEKIGEGMVQTANIAGGAVYEAKIANSAVTTAKIADDAVTMAKLADDVTQEFTDLNNAIGDIETLLSAI